MERDQQKNKQQPAPPSLSPPRRAHGDRKEASASFSASLLDAIYRSLDEGNDGNNRVDINGMPLPQEKATAPPQFWWARQKAKSKPTASADKRRHEPAVARPRHSGYASSTTSSDSSSSYGFSCSSSSTTDTEPLHRRNRAPPPPEQTEAADYPRNNKDKKKRRPCFPGARLRRRGGPSSPQPPSPATFACLLKALFTSGRLPRKPKSPAAVTPPPISQAPQRPSCMSTTSAAKAADVPEAAERRSVRFCTDVEAAVVRRRVEELVRSLGEVEEEDGSDSSSDLFELESLRGAGGDELPVYGTTSLAANRAIAQGAVC